MRVFACLCFLLAWTSGLSTVALARQFPEPQPARYKPFEFPPRAFVTKVPLPCQIFIPLLSCERSADLELALEREYWNVVQRSDEKAMQAWIPRALHYAELSRSPGRARLFMLAAFGEVMIFRSHDLNEPDGLLHAVKGLALVERSHAMADQVPSSISMQHFLLAFISYALGDAASGDSQLESLLTLPDRFGHYGSEGVLVGAFGYMSLLEKKKVQRGLDILDDCNNPHCIRTSSIAPYKMVGNAIAMAEAEAYLGREGKARKLLRTAATWARERYYPTVLLERLRLVENQLLDPDTGLAKQWQKGSSLGSIRLPLGPSQSNFACVTCHAGNEVPESYYQRH